MAIAVVGAVHSLAPAEPFAQARAQITSPGVRPPMTTRGEVDKSSASQGPLAVAAVCTEEFTEVVIVARSGDGDGYCVLFVIMAMTFLTNAMRSVSIFLAKLSATRAKNPFTALFIVSVL